MRARFKLGGILLGAVAFLGAWAAPAKAAPMLGVDIVTNGPNGFALTNPPFTIGWSFDATQTLTVTALGVWDEGANGLVEGHDVGLWKSDGTLLATTTVTNASPIAEASVSGFGRWLFEPLANAVNLSVGSYVIGSVSGNDDFRTFQGSIALGPGVANFDSGKFNFGGTLAFPTQDEASDLSLFGPNFRFDTVQPVPEPASLTLLGLGGLALAGRRWRNRGRVTA